MPESRFEFETQTCVPATHPCLPGHFPQRPLVPAVLLLELAVQALREHSGKLHVIAVHSAKFLHPVLPETTIRLHLAADPAAGRARFQIWNDSVLAAQGELGFANT